MRKILFIEEDEFSERFYSELSKYGNLVRIKSNARDFQKEIKKNLDAEIMISVNIRFDEDFLEKFNRIKLIILRSTGYNNVDLNYCKKREIVVCNLRDFCFEAVAQHFFGLLLSLYRKITLSQKDISNGVMNEDYTGYELKNKKLGLVGFGKIGKEVVRIGRAFKMKISYTNSKSTQKEIDKLFIESDIIGICCLLNKDTFHLVDERRLSLMNKNSVLVNIARGEIVDQNSLISFLKKNKIFGAALDVVENGKFHEIDPIMIKLSKMRNVVITPHIAYYTFESILNKEEEILKVIRFYINGNVINRVF